MYSWRVWRPDALHIILYNGVDEQAGHVPAPVISAERELGLEPEPQRSGNGYAVTETTTQP